MIRQTELLTIEAIQSAITPQAAARMAQLEILATIDSTNTYLQNKKDLPNGYLCLAEQQTAARGRRDKPWHAPAGKNIYLSLCWYFTNAEQLAGLSLVVGIAVANTLIKYGLPTIELKWPNDILYNQQKLCGILVEINKEKDDRYRAIIGIGINVAIPAENNIINQPWTDIETILQKPVARNLLAAHLINELLTLLPGFQTNGLTPFLTQWQQYDVLLNKPVMVQQQHEQLPGIALGIDNKGNLLVNFDGTIKPVYSSEVSVRLTKKYEK